MSKTNCKQVVWHFIACLMLICFLTAGVFTGPVQAADSSSENSTYLKKVTDPTGRNLTMSIISHKPTLAEAKLASQPSPNFRTPKVASASGSSSSIPNAASATINILSIPNAASATINILSNVPSFDWCYGCSATAAAMLFGYYDRTGYSNMYTGPTNGGICPMNNTTWGSGESPLSATHNGKDGRTIKGHVDDYWISYDSDGPDPWEGNWTEHTLGDCTADYMGTNQWKYGYSSTVYNPDGCTLFWWDDTPLYDYTGSEAYYRDGCHGMRLFAESRGYTVTSNFSQAIIERTGTSQGFTFAQFQAEIDAGRPVIIQVTNHSMLGYGYDTTSGNTIYVRNTWTSNENNIQTMTWGGYYQTTYRHEGVTVFRMAAIPITSAPTLSSPASGATVTGTSIPFTWSAVSGATGYWLSVRKTSDGTFLFNQYVGSGTTYTVSGFPNNGTVYNWTMAAGNSAGYGPAAAALTFTNGTAVAVPAAPTLTTPASGATVSGTSVTFTWSASSGATGYWLSVRKTSDGTYICNQYVGSGTTYTVSGFPNNGTIYNWTMAAGNSSGWSTAAATQSFTSGTSVTVPSAPTLTTPASGATVSGTSITFTWGASSGATGYWLSVRKTSDGTYICNQYVGSGTTYTVSGFPNNGTIYNWTMAAGNSSGWSTAAATRSFTNGIIVPSAPTLTTPASDATVSGTSITFTWQASTGATGYWLTVRKTSDSSIFINKYVGNVLTYTQTGFPNDGTQYTWTMAAGNSSGWSPAATSRSFINGP